MATKTFTVCDLCDEEEAHTNAVVLNGVSVEVDLCDDHLFELTEALEVFVKAGRPTGSKPVSVAHSRRRPSVSAVPAGVGVDTKTVRAWAAANGMAVASRGRLHPDVLAAYNQAVGA